MQCNVGDTDRALRIVAGLAMIGAGVFYESWWGAVGLAPLLTGIFRFCPAYVPFKLKT